MSDSRWCDYGNHSFSANDQDAVQDTIKMKVKQSDGSYLPRQYERDICGPHVAEAVNFERPQLTEGEPGEAPNRTA